jgi:hypothetical protein
LVISLEIKHERAGTPNQIMLYHSRCRWFVEAQIFPLFDLFSGFRKLNLFKILFDPGQFSKYGMFPGIDAIEPEKC